MYRNPLWRCACLRNGPWENGHAGPSIPGGSANRLRNAIHPPAFTAQKRAKYLAVSGKQVAKCVLLSGPDGYFLAVLPSTHHLDPDLLADRLGGPIRLATDREIAELFRDCEWGVVLPFGSLYGLNAPTVMDEAFGPETLLIFEGHTHAEAIRLHVRDYERWNIRSGCFAYR